MFTFSRLVDSSVQSDLVFYVCTRESVGKGNKTFSAGSDLLVLRVKRMCKLTIKAPAVVKANTLANCYNTGF